MSSTQKFCCSFVSLIALAKCHPHLLESLHIPYYFLPPMFKTAIQTHCALVSKFPLLCQLLEKILIFKGLRTVQCKGPSSKLMDRL